jgi:hypothetical protein
MSVRGFGIFAVLCLIIISGIAFADPAPLELTMDKTRLVHLEQDAASVIVANPTHVSVSLENPRLLFLTPHEAGATSMIVLDAAGKTILEQELVVTNVQQKYVRVRRMCGGGDASCAAQSYTYCPDGCYEVTPVAGTGGGASPPPPTTPQGSAKGKPAETQTNTLDDCPEGYAKSAAPDAKGNYACTKR